MENYVNNSVFELQPVLVERDLYAGSNSSQQLICTFFVDFWCDYFFISSKNKLLLWIHEM